MVLQFFKKGGHLEGEIGRDGSFQHIHKDVLVSHTGSSSFEFKFRLELVELVYVLERNAEVPTWVGRNSAGKCCWEGGGSR